MASYAETKIAEMHTEHQADGKARAKLRNHLAGKGYVVEESDKLGPVVVTVVGMDTLQTWRRESKDGKDFNMILESVRQLSYE